MLQFIPGTDFITSGYGAIPRPDNMFGGGNFDVTEMDDWYVLQRDMRVDGGITPAAEADVLRVRERAARALQAVFAGLDFPPITDEEIQAVTTAFSSDDVPNRDRVADIDAAQRLLDGPLTVLDVVKALDKAGFTDVAANVLEMQRQRVIGDYLQTSAIFDKDFHVLSALTDPNDYRGPGSGYRVDGERWQALQNLPQAWDPRDYMHKLDAGGQKDWLQEVGPAQKGDGSEVIIAVGPAFGGKIPPDHRRPRPSRRAGRADAGLARRRRGGAPGARLPYVGLRLHRARRRTTQRVGRVHRHPVQGDDGHPSPRPAPARQSGAVSAGAQP